jgi:hypothetical protein
MHELLMPQFLARARIERHERVPIQVVSGSIRTIKIRGRRA